MFDSEHRLACARKKQELSEKLRRLTPEYSEPLTEEEHHILDLSIAQLVDEVNSGSVKPAAVLSAHGKQSLTAQANTNCLADVMFEEGLRNVSLNKSLSGVPISLKDSVDIRGHDTTLGYSCRANKPVDSDAAIVRLLHDAGALIHVKTTVPTGLFSFETRSDLFGETSNPYNPDFSPGASTGGGAALLAYSGSKVEIASDIGGSVRFPSAYCGVYGMKASYGRFPNYGTHASTGGMYTIRTIASPMAKTLEDLITFWERVIAMQPWEYDQSCLPIPWRPVDFVLAGRKPRWGVIWDDGIIPPTPACERALKSAVEALRKQGHEVITFVPPDIEEAMKIGFQLLTADGYDTVFTPLRSGEYISDALTLIRSALKLPLFAKRLVASLLRMFSQPPGRNDFFAAITEVLHPKSIQEERELALQLEHTKQQWFEAMKAQGVDFLLTPLHPLPPIPKGKSATVTLISASYAFLFNILDFTAGVVPVTFVDSALDSLPRNFQETDAFKKLSDPGRGAWSCYDANAMHGLPLSVQISGKRLEEEKVLEGMMILEAALRDTERPFIQKEFV
ncbi:amidase signature enzyme [Panus rudis PR-1116 ss-1]|nr:amidase signature enzyme [Panus rudis PR-1116 ss-1]